MNVYYKFLQKQKEQNDAKEKHQFKSHINKIVIAILLILNNHSMLV